MGVGETLTLRFFRGPMASMGFLREDLLEAQLFQTHVFFQHGECDKGSQQNSFLLAILHLKVEETPHHLGVGL